MSSDSNDDCDKAPYTRRGREGGRERERREERGGENNWNCNYQPQRVPHLIYDTHKTYDKWERNRIVDVHVHL